jgi:hypothetical protein
LVDSEAAEEIAELDALRSDYDQVQNITRLMRNKTMGFRTTGSVFHLIKGVPSQTDKRALDSHQPRGPLSLSMVEDVLRLPRTSQRD